jgi:hypothetical protein
MGRDAGAAGVYAASPRAVPAAHIGRDRRTSLLLEAPLASTLLKLAAPNVLVMVAQSSVGLVET